MFVKDAFADNLRQLREVAGLSQSQLAEKLKVSRGSISYYENGDRVPDIEFLDSVSMFFDVPLDYLLGYSNNKKAEYIDFGKKTGLSDEAINNLCENDFATGTINFMLETEEFYKLVQIVDAYINHSYEDMRKKCDQRLSRLFMADENYLEFLISDYVISILKSVKEKAVTESYKHYTNEQVLEALDEYEQILAKHNQRKEQQKIDDERREKDNQQFLIDEAENIKIREAIKLFIEQKSGEPNNGTLQTENK